VACSFDLSGKRVLDVGCADGLHAMYMGASAKEVWGIDHRVSEIEKGRATIAAMRFNNVHLKFGDVRNPNLFQELGIFDLVTAWGFLHRIGDIFSFLYAIAPLTNALSLEWRTPVIPLMSTLSIAYHPPGKRELDPMNVRLMGETDSASDKQKVEGKTAFWEPTPGAIKVIMRRLGFGFERLVGYGERLDSEKKALSYNWSRHIKRVIAGRGHLSELPRERVHMIFEKKRGSVSLLDLREAPQRLPPWDVAMHRSFTESP
jgi:hypothetical protein